ncbi:MAG: ABC transporter permease [Gammaproteobacteria bacterium]|mgnify:FL=1|nr:MAG: ABC transporter permease [Gammaproteobacteria bacterium]
MIQLIFKRLLTYIPVLLIVVIITFLMIHAAPGGPFDAERVASPEILDKLNEAYDLDKPLYVQITKYLVSAAQGDFGPSFKYPGRSVAELIMSGLPTTIELAFYSILFAIFLGVSSGLLASLYPGKLLDVIPMSISLLGICIPSIILGPVLVLIFGIWYEILPVYGWGDNPGDKILPTITLGTAYAAIFARLTRGGMLEVLGQDFIRTARAKGLTEIRIVLVHALRAGILPVISFLGPAIAGLLAGSFVVETIFQINGVGRFYIQAAFNRDYTMILGTSILFTFMTLTFVLLSDILASFLNPTLRDSGGLE